MVKSLNEIPLVRTENAVTPAAGCTKVLALPAPVIVSVLVSAITEATAKLPAPILMLSPDDDAVTACAIVLQFGETVVQVFEPLPGTNQVVAAETFVAVTASRASTTKQKRCIIMRASRGVEIESAKGNRCAIRVAEAPLGHHGKYVTPTTIVDFRNGNCARSDTRSMRDENERDHPLHESGSASLDLRHLGACDTRASRSWDCSRREDAAVYAQRDLGNATSYRG